MARRRRRKARGCLTQKCRDRKKWARAMSAAAKKGFGRRTSRKKSAWKGSYSSSTGYRGRGDLVVDSHDRDSRWLYDRARSHPAYASENRARRPSARSRVRPSFAGLRGCGCG